MVESKKVRLGRGIIIILFANVLNMVFSLLTNFLLPRYLSVDSYSAIKTYQLYMTYAGLFALGFSDGVYLKYGGKEMEAISLDEQRRNLASIRLVLFVETAIVSIVSLLFNDRILLAFALSILSYNMIGYFKNLYQAVGLFKKYSRILNITTFLSFFVNMILLFVFRTDAYFTYLLGYVIVNAFIWYLLEAISAKSIGNTFRISYFSRSLTLSNIKNGILLMIGNLSSVLFTGMDRWFVKFLLLNYDFAIYSFAVTLEGFLNVAITPLTITLYNYFCTNNDAGTVNRIRRVILVLSTAIIASVFILGYLIERVLPNYGDSLEIVYLLFVSQLFFIPNKAIYINIYKAKGQQNKYFYRLLIALAVGFITNAAFYYFDRTRVSFAYATFTSSFVWLLLSVLDFKMYKISMREILFCLFELALFFFATRQMVLIGFLIYTVGSIALICLIMRDDAKYMFSLFKSILLSKRGAVS